MKFFLNKIRLPKIRKVLSGSFAIVVAAVVAAVLLERTEAPRSTAAGRPQEAPTLPVIGEIPDFALIERSGAEFRQSDLEGNVWIADFIFTRCAGVCPLMSARMRGLQDSFRNEPGIRFVSFSVDPGYDTPEVLAEYAGRFHADPDKWFFLTGNKKEIYELSEQHFHLGVGEVPPEERETAGQNVRHSSRFVLLDTEGKIRGYYDSESYSSLNQLIQDARRLLEV